MKLVLNNILFVAIIAYSTWCLVWAVHEIYLMAQSQYWPKLVGTIRVSHVRPSGGRYGQPDIVYEYSFNGTSYQSSKVVFGDTLGSRSTAEALIAQFPVGRSVDVVFNPANPAMSCLIPGPMLYWETFAMLFLSACFVLFGVVVLQDDYKRRTKNTA